MPPLKSYNAMLQKILDYYAPDVGKSLIHLGALGWFLSAAAQVTMLIRNKDIDKKEKQFLVPQEIADGAINVGLYYTICQGIKYIGEQILERGHLLTEKSFNTLLELKPTPNSTSDYIKAMNELFIGRGFVDKKNSVGRLTNFYKGAAYILDNFQNKEVRAKVFFHNKMLESTFEPIFEANKVKQTKRFLNRALKDFSRFKNGVGVIAAVGASVLACNLITPITRNITANAYQKAAIKRQQNNKPSGLSLPQPYKMPVSNTFSGFKI